MSLFVSVLIILLFSYGQTEGAKERAKNNRASNVNEDSTGSQKTVTLDDDPSLWPGHLQEFGKTGRVHTLDLHRNFPSSVDFLNNYAAPYLPVYFKAAEKNSFPFQNWKNKNYFLRLPQTLTNWVTLPDQNKNISFRKYISHYADKGYYCDQEIPHFLREDVSVPKCLLCQAMVKSLSKHNLWISHHNHSSIIQRRNTDTIKCVYVGRQEVTMISHIEYGEKIPADYKDIDVKHVDYNKYPTLREVEYFKVKVKAGDCLFIPTKWYWQVNSYGKTYSVNIEWYHRAKSVKDSDCKMTNTISNLNSVSFKDGPGSDINKQEIILHYLTSYLTESKNFTHKQFENAIKKDKKLMEDMVEWNDEYEEITKEVFDILDVNKDSIFSLDDLDSLNSRILEDIGGLLEDRIQDYEDLMKDQQDEIKQVEELTAPKDKKSDVDAEKAVQDYLKDYLAQLQDVIHESIDEMAVTGQLPDIKQRFAEKQGQIGQKPDDSSTKTSQKNGRSEREKAKAKIKLEREKKKLKEKEDNDLQKEKQKDESFVIVDDSIEEEIIADDEEDIAKKSDKTKSRQDKMKKNDEL
ncbi:uncharacterized protein LOC126809859 isoform X2 [Patella vulgata]|uniref:uncharacterized protein LOC126809859 isoform X2 n=1 Tax=Patella vulgata TaxID=6465 RepID=UPI00218008AA|nr:uncharacterized protein LOC126809859 isoform X2 [Patella vulgata]